MASQHRARTVATLRLDSIDSTPNVPSGTYRLIMAVVAVTTKPTGDGGEYKLYLHHDGTSDLWLRERHGTPAYRIAGPALLYKVREAMRERGISEDGRTPA